MVVPVNKGMFAGFVSTLPDGHGAAIATGTKFATALRALEEIVMVNGFCVPLIDPDQFEKT